MAILIKDPDRCPGCASYNSLRWDQHKCGECGARIFRPSDNFVQLQYDCIFSYWVFFPLNGSSNFKGWVHSAHLKDGKPNNPDYTAEKPSTDYAMQKRHPGIGNPVPLQVVS